MTTTEDLLARLQVTEELEVIARKHELPLAVVVFQERADRIRRQLVQRWTTTPLSEARCPAIAAE